jgi:hypothetical protein
MPLGAAYSTMHQGCLKNNKEKITTHCYVSKTLTQVFLKTSLHMIGKSYEAISKNVLKVQFC